MAEAEASIPLMGTAEETAPDTAAAEAPFVGAKVEELTEPTPADAIASSPATLIEDAMDDSAFAVATAGPINEIDDAPVAAEAAALASMARTVIDLAVD